MFMELMKNWEFVVDGFQMFLCLMIIFLLMRNHRRRLKSGLADPGQAFGQDFNMQMFAQTISQQVELAFNNIQNTVDHERRNIEKLMQLQQVKSHEQPSPEILPSLRPTNGRGATESPDKSADRSTLQTRIRKMTIRGMSPKQIADELKTPLGEIELILNMQHNA
jgi:hypothetical protein